MGGYGRAGRRPVDRQSLRQHFHIDPSPSPVTAAAAAVDLTGLVVSVVARRLRQRGRSRGDRDGSEGYRRSARATSVALVVCTPDVVPNVHSLLAIPSRRWRRRSDHRAPGCVVDQSTVAPAEAEPSSVTRH